MTPHEARPTDGAAPQGTVPRCPITGRPATRLIQTVSARFLIDLWRYSARVDVANLLRPAGKFRLWESPTGLAFFDPMVAGDDAFYTRFYRNFALHKRLGKGREARHESQLAASHVPEGASVLDVGCGEGFFRTYVPQASSYTGLDPYFAATDPSGAILAETLEEHAVRRPGHYDVVCAFHVVEHTTEPLAFAGALLRCLKPGGTLLVAVPAWPTLLTQVPNFVLNAPPHHLTWWTPSALSSLSEELGLATEAVHTVEMSQHEALVYWMSLVNPVKATGPFFKHKWSWHGALALSYAFGRTMETLFPLPQGRGSNTLLLAARKAG